MTAWIGLLARIVVGGVFVVAGALKLPEPAQSVAAVRAYDLLPEAVVPAFGQTLPVLEVVVGLALLVGLVTRVAGVVSALLQLAFIIGLVSVWARGMEINCGCFGGAESGPSNYPLDLLRDTGLLLGSLWLVGRPRTPWSIDALLHPASSGLPAHPGLDPDLDPAHPHDHDEETV